MELTADFIRSLSGLSVAELSDKVIETLQVITVAEEAALEYPTLSDSQSLYYQGYKAITILGPSLLLSLAERVKDNFNEFTRYDNLDKLLELASAKVAEVEDSGGSNYNLFSVVVPAIDPVIGEGR